jgi:hypothetical protein
LLPYILGSLFHVFFLFAILRYIFLVYQLANYGHYSIK